MLLCLMAILFFIMPQLHILLTPGVQLQLRHHSVPRFALEEALFSEVLGLLMVFLVAMWVFRKMATRTVQITPKGIWVKTEQNALLLKWRYIRYIVEQGEYNCIVNGGLAATVIPKVAFNNPAEAYKFFDTALAFWREAKGIAPPPSPDVLGVWPPVPRTGDSQELGETPKH